MSSSAAIPSKRVRFVAELEFVQCLCNPKYLNFLAQRDYFDDRAFLAFLEYLKYWRNPRYARYLVYPQCLAVLDMLGDSAFRENLRSGAFCDKLIEGQNDQLRRKHEQYMAAVRGKR